MRTQQEETLAFFRRIARQWRSSAEGRDQHTVNVIKQRNDYVVEVARANSMVSSALDLGCGTGELVCDLARMGVTAVGVDFAEEMISLCRQKAAAESLDRCKFVAASVFDYEPDVQCDLISANGLIEYISPLQLLDLVRRTKRWLKPGGDFVFGSRNRLFNVFSLNDYTKMELEHDCLTALVSEAITIAESPTEQECVAELCRPTQGLPPLDQHPKTGIDVTTRHQYTPAQLVQLLVSEGFRTVGLYPIHYHGVPPRFGRENSLLHVAISGEVQQHPRHYLVPFSSSFMIHARVLGER
jgi:2-polyprenyl-3-methyl-5-hydroxy-6-metoxy-1,4-benzoquinol methylase